MNCFNHFYQLVQLILNLRIFLTRKPFFICFQLRLNPTVKRLNSRASVNLKVTSLPCPFCKLVFSKKAQLHEHLSEIHAIKSQIVCQVCQKVFKTNSGLELHMAIHNGKARYSCTVCGHPCSSTTQLEGHMNKHRGIKPHKCPICPAAFSYSHGLSSHQKKMNHYY